MCRASDWALTYCAQLHAAALDTGSDHESLAPPLYEDMERTTNT